MSSRLRCKDSQLTPTLTAAAPRTKRGPQPFAKSAGRLKVRTGFCDTVIKAAEATTTKEEPSYTAKPGLDEGFIEYGPDPAAQPAANAILADSSQWPSGQYPPALHLRPPPPPPARPHQQQKQRRQQQQQQRLYSFRFHPRRQRHEDEEEEEQDGSQKRPHSPSSHEHGAQVYAQELQANKHVQHHHPRQSDQPPESEVWEESRDDEQAGLAVMPTEAAAAAAAGGSSGVRRSGSCGGVPRYKRPAHIDAEYRRRGKIQRGFELVQSLVPALQQTSVNAKQSKASMLTRSAEYIRELAETVECQKVEMEALQEEAEALQRDLQMYQQQLPSSGVNAVERPSCRTERMMEQYLQSSIAQDWKFWIFSFLVRPLSESFMASVSLKTHQEFYRTLHEWSDRHLTLVNLRPITLTLLRSVSTTTSIITDPDKFPQEVHALANCNRKPSALTSHGSSDCCPSTRQ